MTQQHIEEKEKAEEEAYLVYRQHILYITDRVNSIDSITDNVNCTDK